MKDSFDKTTTSIDVGINLLIRYKDCCKKINHLRRKLQIKDIPTMSMSSRVNPFLEKDILIIEKVLNELEKKAKNRT